MRTWRASQSTSEKTAALRMPASRQARMTRTAISPRLAIRSLPNTPRPPPGATPGPASGVAPRLAGMELQRREEVRDLERRGLGRVGAVDRVGLDRGGELPADRTRRRLGGIGRPHQIAQPPDGVVALQDHRQARPGGHELAEAR